VGLVARSSRNAKETAKIEQIWHVLGRARLHKPPKKYDYVEELAYFQLELIKLQEWIRMKGLRVCVLFEGRDAVGKGGVIKRITQSLNPRVCRVVALGTPTEKERGQWYFQRYVDELPSRGEIVLFDRSWYNRAGADEATTNAGAAKVTEASIVVRKGTTVFNISIPRGPQARQQLVALSEVVVSRLKQ
jgi:polyphosphate kinase 2 (PPK2 family)